MQTRIIDTSQIILSFCSRANRDAALGGGDNEGRVRIVPDAEHNERNKLLHEFEDEEG